MPSETAALRGLPRAAGLAYQRLLDTRAPLLLVLALVTNLIAITFVARVTLRGFPNSGDEYAYLLSAQLFAEGELYVPSPEPRRFFDVWHVVNDGRYYGKYPPGWPAVLAPFVRLGVPWAANLGLALGALAVIFAMARRHFSLRVANATALVALCCPFVVFNSASLFSHPLLLLSLSVATWAVLECLARPGNRAWYLALGASLGLALITRPFTAAISGAVLGAYLLIRGRAHCSTLLRNLVLFTAPCLGAFVALLLLYQRATTGQWLLQPFEVYDPTDRLGFHREPRTLSGRLRQNVIDRLELAMHWVPLSPLLVLGHWLLPRRDPGEAPGQGKEALLLALLLVVLAGYVPYWGAGGNQYGPRYLYDVLFALLLLSGAALARLKALGPLVLGAVLVLGVVRTGQAHVFHGAEVRERLQLFDLVREKKLDGALIFVATGSGSMARRDLIRNGTRFDGPVVFAHDRGAENALLRARYPDRSVYRFRFDPRTRRGELLPLEPSP